MSRLKWCVGALVALVLAVPSLAAAQAPAAPRFTVEKMLELGRVSDPQLSPDGRFVAYVVIDGQPREEQPRQPHLAGAGGRRRADAARSPRRLGRVAALVARRQAPRVPLDARRQLRRSGWRTSTRAARPASRGRSPASPPRCRASPGRPTASRSSSRPTSSRRARTCACNEKALKDYEARHEQGARLRPPDVPPLDGVEGRALQPPVPRSRRTAPRRRAT